MEQFNFNEIKIFDDELSDMDIIKSIINDQDQEDAFYILDVAKVVEKHKEWIAKIPRVIPHFAMKCNPDETVVKVLAALNGSFDCASEREIRQVMQWGVPARQIIFANPAKCPSHIKFAQKVGVSKMTVDSEIELLKIKNLYPEAEVIIRIRCDAKNTDCVLGLKYGCEPNQEAIELIQLTIDLGLKLYGFSFHVGSPCRELAAYSRGIEICKRLVNIAKSMKCKDVKLIDIGGGMPGESEFEIAELAKIIDEAIKDVDPSVTIASEPGSYYVTSAFSLSAYLHSKKLVVEDDILTRMYYINCGVYNSFIEELMNIKARVPVPLHQVMTEEKFSSTIWGPTCDSYDCILKNAPLPEFHIGDWLVWKNMGSYSISMSCSFNGFLPPVVYPIIRKTQWKVLHNEISLAQSTKALMERSKGINGIDRNSKYEEIIS